MIARIVVSAVAAALLLVGGAGDALASGPIGPGQHFAGLVNGKRVAAVIYMVCPGPGGPGRTGPPAGGQSVAVTRVHAGGGYTGAGGGPVYARIAPAAVVTITAYDLPAPIPTSIRLPCDGKGAVVFSTCPLPAPCGAGARVDDLTVRFVNLAV